MRVPPSVRDCLCPSPLLHSTAVPASRHSGSEAVRRYAHAGATATAPCAAAQSLIVCIQRRLKLRAKPEGRRITFTCKRCDHTPQKHSHTLKPCRIPDSRAGTTSNLKEEEVTTEAEVEASLAFRRAMRSQDSECGCRTSKGDMSGC